MMKNLVQTILLGLLGGLAFEAKAQSQLFLNITNISSTSIQINWASDPGTSYRLLFAESLDAPISWKPLADVFAIDADVSATVTKTGQTVFFKAEIPTNGTLPAVQIFSPTNGQTISGTITIGIGAQIGPSLSAVQIYLDDALIDSISSGGLTFDLDTTHFANGTHTLYAVAIDEANNETASEIVSVDFQNSVRWLDGDPLFQAFVPIHVESDIFPADWTVFVVDGSNTVVRAFSGTTSDGIIQTYWDGNDQNGQYAPDETTYALTISVTSQGSGGSALMTSSSANADWSITSSQLNRYGMMEYEIEQSVPDAEEMYAAMLKNYLRRKQQDVSLPPLPPRTTKAAKNKIKRKVSTREMLMVPSEFSSSGTAGQNSNLSGQSGSSSWTVWRERAWQSGQTVLARQKISGIVGLIYDGLTANMLATIKNLISVAANDLGGNRDVYLNSVLLMANSGDYVTLTNALASSNPDVRAFYFYGHGGSDGNSFGAGNVRATNIAKLLHNYQWPATNGYPPLINDYKPFSFVFLDGCMTGKGAFPEAFGIPKKLREQAYLAQTKRKRAFMGWGGVVSNSILNNDFLDWTKKFWETWLSGSYNVTLQGAVDAANAHKPDVVNDAPILIYGANSLTWGE